MKNIPAFTLLASLSLFLTGCNPGRGRLHKPESYTWKNVRIVGGGFVDGFVYHPEVKGLVYARTDMGGAYRRDSAEGDWTPLMDWVSYEDVNLMGVETIALDPNDPDKLYMACGTYSNDRAPDGEILRSSDRGETFERTKVPFKMGGNENGRGNGERMTVDPNNGNILYLGTRHAGLWRSTDGAVTWQKVESFPGIKETVPDSIKERQRRRYWSFAMTGSGIVSVICDPASAQRGAGS
ncbi:MAG TPA: hypothetical protein VE870_12935, partial [Bacteroidales bacterium]|nr:hypothetical protein [Bacteroidales bacterium]